MDPLPDNAITITVTETLRYAPGQIIKYADKHYTIHAIIDATRLWIVPADKESTALEHGI